MARDGTLTEVPLGTMPQVICGVNGPVPRRDLRDGDVSCAAGAR